MSPPPFLGAAELARRLLPGAAADALEAALAAGLDPSVDPPRSSVSNAAGELLLMPSTAAGPVGVKLATVAPANPRRGLPRIQGVYALFDPDTLAPAALIDGIALTTLRTSAVSALAVRHLAAPGARRLLVYGTGPQAWAHVEALREARPIDRVDVIARDRDRTEAFVRRCAHAGLAASVGDPAEAVPGADLICCCTTAREPLFDGALVRADATVVAVGSHEPGAREVDDALAGRSTVVVEERAGALREAGDVILAVQSGALDPASLLTLAELARGEGSPLPERPRLFKSTGMAWEDAVVAAAAVAADPPLSG